jgi:hypothetical protein
MKQKYALCMLAIIISTALFCGCGKDNATEPNVVITAAPVLNITNTDYQSTDNFVDTTSFINLRNAYKNRYTDELKKDIFNHMLTQVAQSGQDTSCYKKCLNATKLPFSTGKFLLSYAEKAKYKGRNVWIFQSIYGFDPGEPYGYEIIFIDAVSLETISSLGIICIDD